MTEYVYFARNERTKFIKIGYSASVGQRISRHRTETGSPITLLGILEGGREKERELHIQFKEFHVTGEWFRPGKPLLDYISQHTHMPKRKRAMTPAERHEHQVNMLVEIYERMPKPETLKMIDELCVIYNMDYHTMIHSMTSVFYEHAKKDEN